MTSAIATRQITQGWRRALWRPAGVRLTFLAALALVSATAAELRAQATLLGTVLADSSKQALANAEVSIAALKRSVRTDSAGRFQLAGLPAGPHDLRIRLVGYEAVSTRLTFAAEQQMRAAFILRPTRTTLNPVNVRGERSRRSPNLAQFEENARAAEGRFLTADVFEKAEGQPLIDVITRRIPGLRKVRMGAFTEVLASMRTTRTCPMQIVLNNMVMTRPGIAPFDLGSISTTEVIGLEFYTVNSTPMLYNGQNAACGTIVIWTRDGPPVPLGAPGSAG